MEEIGLNVIILIGVGLYTLLASAMNWNFFFESRKAAFFVRVFGRNGARIFYGALSFLIFFLAYKVALPA